MCVGVCLPAEFSHYYKYVMLEREEGQRVSCLLHTQHLSERKKDELNSDTY